MKTLLHYVAYGPEDEPLLSSQQRPLGRGCARPLLGYRLHYLSLTGTIYAEDLDLVRDFFAHLDGVLRVGGRPIGQAVTSLRIHTDLDPAAIYLELGLSDPSELHAIFRLVEKFAQQRRDARATFPTAT